MISSFLSERRRTAGGDYSQEKEVSVERSDVLDDTAVPEKPELESLKLRGSFSELKELKGDVEPRVCVPFLATKKHKGRNSHKKAQRVLVTKRHKSIST